MSVKLNLPEQTLKNLQQQLGSTYDFLGFTVNLQAGTLTDNLTNNTWKDLCVRLIPAMLHHYAAGNPVPLKRNLVKFKDILGGYAYEGAFIERAIKPIEKVFGEKPEELPKATQKLCGRPLSLGDAAAEIAALKGIPLKYILHGSEEFGASASILFDESASSYLPTEDLAVLGELTTYRLIEAKKTL